MSGTVVGYLATYYGKIIHERFGDLHTNFRKTEKVQKQCKVNKNTHVKKLMC